MMLFKTFLVVSLVVFLLATPAEGWRRRRRRRRSQPPPDTTAPTFTSCPDYSVSTSESDGRKVVNFAAPTATDNRGSATVSRISGPASGSRFNEGSTAIRYRARDSAGNTRDCIVYIIVTVLRCGSISPSSHRSNSCTKTNIAGSVCTFSCPRNGFDLVGYSSSTCQTSLRWSRSFPTCQVKTCTPTLTSLAHGSVSCTNSNRYGSVCTFRCSSGYGFQGGGTTRTRTCGNSWSGATPTCIDTQAPSFRSCPSTISVVAEDAVTSAVVSWTVPTATDNVPSGLTVALRQGSAPGSRFNQGSHTIQYIATDRQGNTRYCTFSVIVRVITCGSHQASAHLDINCPDGHIKGASCSFSCLTGYQLVGTGSSTCQPSGSWSSARPTCQIRSCPALTAPAHGSFRDSNSCPLTYNSRCRFMCDTGYTITGSSTRRCIIRQNRPVWEGTTTGCQINRCSTLTPGAGLSPTNTGTCSAGNQVTYGATCGYSCSESYRLTGAQTITCGPEGQWLQSLPVCQVITCATSDLPAPSNGQRSGCTGDYVGYGTACTLSCNRGFVPTASVGRTCQSNSNRVGVWSGGTITCTMTTCPQPSAPSHGRLVGCERGGHGTSSSARQPFDSTCSFACNSGFTLSGSASRTCLVSGAWDGSNTQCSDITSPVLQCPSDREFFAGEGQNRISIPWNWEPVEGTDAGHAVSAILVSINSESFTGTELNMLDEGIYSLVYTATDSAGNSASCTLQIEAKVTRCTGLQTPLSGILSLASGHGSCVDGAVYGSQCQITCETGHTLSTGGARLRRQCMRQTDHSIAGFWSLSQPTCEVNTCSYLTVTNGYISGCHGDTATYEDSCQFHCDVGRRTPSGTNYRLRRCQADGSWSGADFQCTVTVTCAGPFSLPYGSVEPAVCSQAPALPYNTECHFSCGDGFAQQGPVSKTCTDNASWDNVEAVMCIDEQRPNFSGDCPQHVGVNSEFNKTSQLVNYDIPAATDNSGLVTVERHSSNGLNSGSRFPEGRIIVTYIATDPSSNSDQCDVIVTVTVYRCQRLQAPSSGSVSCGRSSPIAGTQCTLQCNTGYTLSGSQTRTCQLTNDNSPYWDGQNTVCTIVRCPSQTLPPHSIKSGCSSAVGATETYGTQCSYYCLNGYEAETSDGGRSRCLADGSWSGTDLICSEIECTALDPAPGVDVAPPVCIAQPVFGRSCMFTCSRPGFRVEPFGSAFVSCEGSGRWSQDVSEVHCIDIENPRFTDCPSFLTVYTDRGSTTAQVTPPITATDNDGLSPSVTCDPGSGQYNIGEYRTHCVALDAAGNSDTCSFEVEVIERRCPTLSPPPFGEFRGECHNVYGSTCELKCIDHYRLDGSSQATCEFNGTGTYWQIGEAPRCNLITCDAVSSLPAAVQITPSVCTTGSPPSGSRCSFFCLNGLTLAGGVFLISCGAQGEWDTNVNDLDINCEDRIPPVLTYCPASIITLKEGPAGTSVTFDLPTARDNLPASTLTLETMPADVTSPYLFTELVTEVSYNFTDQGGNSVVCTFKVSVYNDLEPEVVFCPDDRDVVAVERLTEVTWEEPVFQDPTGHELDVNNNIATGNVALLPWGRHTVVYTAVNPDNGQKAACQFTIDIQPVGCMPLDEPHNGALSCVPSGDVCSIFCNEDFMIPRPRGRLGRLPTHPDQYVCSLSGIWRPHDNIPDCSKRRGRTQLPMDLMYFSGDCSRQETQDEIAEAFILMVQMSPFMDSCSLEDKCNIENIQVFCGTADNTGLGQGPRIFRRRRSLDDEEDAQDAEIRSRLLARLEQADLKRRRRDADATFATFISFDLKYEISYEEGVESLDAVVTTETKIKEEAEILMSVIGHTTMDMMSESNMTLEVAEDMMSYGEAKVICEPGYVASNDTYYCTACSSGTWYNQATEDCEYCSSGRYQNQQAKEECIECPSGTSTAEEGAKTSSMCKDVCPAGHYSENGLVPCFKCLVGEFQPEVSQTSCLACPGVTTTQDFGSQSLNHCLDICPPGSYSDTGLAPCLPCEHRYYQPNTGKHHCILCPGRSSTLNAGSTRAEDCSDDADECASSPCGSEATCVDLINGYMCDCPPGYEGDHCEVDMDECEGNMCTHGATCVDELMSYQCLCSPGFEGYFCELDINECASSPCLHDGVCQDAVNGYRCQCPLNYHGVNCEQEIDGCSPSPCQNSAQCELHDGGYRCHCAPGFRGLNCTFDINDCSSYPCQNGGLCRDMPNAFTCECTTGFEGPHCETDVNLCADSPCHDGATCVDLATYFHCVCPPFRSGDLCDATPCQNGALFLLNDNVDAYTCQCVAGYTGLNCEVDYDECASGPCSNGGTCTEHQLNSFMCECPLGFQGDTCSLDINECLSNPCGAQSICEDDANGYMCHCGPGLTGTHCEAHIDYCVPSLCRHGGTCRNAGLGYQCLCVPGFTGHDCETNINDCLTGPCQHGGVCLDRDNSFLCYCRTGFRGHQCEININDCSPSACQNGGICIDGVAVYSCDCLEGFTGAHCEESINYCLSNPCQHLGVCQNDPLGYRCSCTPGYTGANCEEDFDFCSSFPCLHASTCVDGVDGYTCNCVLGYVGTNCEYNIDECLSRPCHNDGTCVDQVGFYICLCAEGYVGRVCEVNFDDCAAERCQNEASCVDGISDFSCLCQPGWTGELCEVNIDECESNPCMNGGVCNDMLGGYECGCLPGYSGPTCQTDINECQQPIVECQHGGSCIDKIADFECACSPGYRGRYCEENIDECASNPCLNGASCVDGVDRFSCDCPTGFAGILCDIELDLCADEPCDNGATCSSHRGSFSCVCAIGYSGDLCDHDIDECLSYPCLHQGTCEDMLDGYQCVCLPGYTGDQCETELPTDFDLVFNNSSESDLIQMTDTTSHDLRAVLASLWVRSATCASNFILMKVSSPSSVFMEIRDPMNLSCTFLSRDVVVDSQVDLCDGRWHNLILTFHATNQEWKFYIDNALAAEGALSSSLTRLPSGLTLSVGPSEARTGSVDMKIELSNVNIWSNALAEVDVQELSSFCTPHTPGDMFAWGQVMSSPGAAVTRTLSMPSVCDDYDECSSSPCESGSTCEDSLGFFICHCAPGWEGDRCQIMIDLCVLQTCLNGGTCHPSLLSTFCECPDNFAGAICEDEIIDGQWTPWLPWSECTQSCGTGWRFRVRVCDNPSPENGGAFCPGSNTQNEGCNTDRCPTCLTLRRPYRGFMDCNTTDTGEQSCSITCRDGYTFSTTPQAVYLCGPSTNHRWDHNPENSRSVRLPGCNALVPRVGATGNVTATYSSLQCSSASDQESIVQTASALLNTTTQGSSGCLALSTCAANVSVSNCVAATHRSERSVRTPSLSPVKLTIVITMDDDTNAPINNATEFESEFQTTLQDLAIRLQTGVFGIPQDGVIVQPDQDTVDWDAWVMCPSGFVESDQEEGYCVKCGLGSISILSPESQDYECRLCPSNTYKDWSTDVCTACPSGMITNNEGSMNISECYEPPMDLWEKDGVPVRMAYTIVGGIALLIIGALVVGIICRKRKHHKETAAETKRTAQVDFVNILDLRLAPIEKKTADSAVANSLFDALPETTPTPSDGPDMVDILHLPSTTI